MRKMAPTAVERGEKADDFESFEEGDVVAEAARIVEM
jgi:hypothetical protein